MFYKFSQISSRVQTADVSVASQKGSMKAGEVTYIPPYTAGSGTSGGANRIAQLQTFFKSGHSDAPVFLRGAGDVLLYRGIMVFSVVGIGLSLFSIYSMATGRMTKKQN